ncbi:MAG: phytanoyl-CoA dioxygenase family protein [Alphaproteobacteria bacterium]|nr:phytanoyl-CoA dioxygenase family protein [Alphaproteobacteria bacterium]
MTRDFGKDGEDWSKNGYCLWPGFLSLEECARYRALCDSVLVQARRLNSEHANSTNIAWLTHPRYWMANPDGLLELLNFIAAPRAVDRIRDLCGAPPLFNNTQYFAEPESKAWVGIWHRDCQFLAADEAAETTLRERFTGVHLHIALVADDSLAYVPGSQGRIDTPAERRIRWAPEKAVRCSEAMAGARRIVLRAGDAVLFNAWGIHQGRYDPARARRTLDILYQFGELCREAVPPPTCFEDPAILERASPEAQAFFGRFIDAYAPLWAAGEHAWADGLI